MGAVYASEARRNLYNLVKRVNADRDSVEIVTREGPRAYLVDAETFESMAETNYLLQSPVNASRLRAALDDVRSDRNLVAPTAAQLAAIAAGKTEACLG